MYTLEPFSSSDAGSLVIALVAIAGAGVPFKLARRTKISPEDLDRTTVIPEVPVVQIPYTAPANA